MSELPIPTAPAMDPAELLRTMMRRKWLLLLPWLAALAIGVAAAFLLKPVYFSTTLLLLDRGQAMQGPLGSISGGPDVEQQADIMREQVQSSLFLRSVVAATGVKEDRATRAWALKSAAKYPGLSQDEQVEAFLVDQLRTNISIKRSKGKLFQVQVADFDAERARKFCEAVSNQFVASSKARQLEAVQAQQEFSVEQLQVYKRALQEAEMKLEGARRAVISSSRRILGSHASARPSSTRFCWPYERAETCLLRRSSISRNSMISSTLRRARTSSWRGRPQNRKDSRTELRKWMWRPTSRFSTTVPCLKSARFWKVLPTPAPAKSDFLRVAVSTPLIRTRPALNGTTPLIRLNNVVLPAPFGPIKLTISPGITLRLTSWTARTPPKVLDAP